MSELERLIAERQKLREELDNLRVLAKDVKLLIAETQGAVNDFQKSTREYLGQVTKLSESIAAGIKLSSGSTRQQRYVENLLLKGICAQCGQRPKSENSKRFCDECLKMFRDRAAAARQLPKSIATDNEEPPVIVESTEIEIPESSSTLESSATPKSPSSESSATPKSPSSESSATPD